MASLTVLSDEQWQLRELSNLKEEEELLEKQKAWLEGQVFAASDAVAMFSQGSRSLSRVSTATGCTSLQLSFCASEAEWHQRQQLLAEAACLEDTSIRLRQREDRDIAQECDELRARLEGELRGLALAERKEQEAARELQEAEAQVSEINLLLQQVEAARCRALEAIASCGRG